MRTRVCICCSIGSLVFELNVKLLSSKCLLSVQMCGMFHSKYHMWRPLYSFGMWFEMQLLFKKSWMHGYKVKVVCVLLLCRIFVLFFLSLFKPLEVHDQISLVALHVIPSLPSISRSSGLWLKQFRRNNHMRVSVMSEVL